MKVGSCKQGTWRLEKHILLGISAREAGGGCCFVTSLVILSDCFFPQFCELLGAMGWSVSTAHSSQGTPNPPLSMPTPTVRAESSASHTKILGEAAIHHCHRSPRAAGSLCLQEQCGPWWGRYWAGFSTVFLSCIVIAQCCRPGCLQSDWVSSLGQPLPSRVLAVGWGLSWWSGKLVWSDCEHLEGGNFLCVFGSWP